MRRWSVRFRSLDRSILLIPVIVVAVLRPIGVAGQNSNQIYDHMLFARGSALGSQAMAGDLLAAALDPTVAAGNRLGAEAAGGSHELDLRWTAAGVRFEALDRRFAVVIASLSYGSQLRTDLDDRLGLFGGSFTPSDLSVTGATLLLAEGDVVIAAGGTLTAFLFPVLALIVLLAAHGNPPVVMGFEQMQGLLANWFGKLVAFGTVTLALWHAAHRLRTALHGLGLRADSAVATVGYGIALVGTVLVAYYLLQI